ncbi:hypothetical protein B1A87_005975 [Arthrobacter sp. KBS0703]|jgi:hypothetical protein|uniref:hypothetical protein n=1 Tax=Bacteria TaxID=2 RepID=UPI00098F8BAB|nr:hypothetical protein [Arthrobacter sp. KBS0703]TSE15514.1 hypothetical protein B1A87_005975 [Arthrobacter sp. KBS0703]
MSAPAGRPDRILIVILSVIAGLVVLALAAVFFRGQPEPLSADTPAGVVQRYAEAVLDGDEAGAASYLAESSGRQCGPVDSVSTRSLRVTLLSTTERPDSADVHVVLTVSNGNGPFGNPEYETEDVFDLVKVNGKWLVKTAPWQLTVCPDPLGKP